MEKEYNGHKIRFDDEKEVWYIVLDFKRQENKRIKIIQAYIDRLNKNSFKRVPIYLEKNGRYWASGDLDEGYQEATITSVGVDGTIFVVAKGEKHASHSWGGYVQNAANKKLLDEIMEINKTVKKLEKDREKKKDALEKVDIEKLRRQVLGEKE